jgi:predicted enzyme related to lactoylglutathione lyase
MKNAIDWFAIPATDMDRAVQFYETVLSVKLMRTEAENMKFAVFPHDRNSGEHVGGALVQIPQIRPSDAGTLVYLHAGEDLTASLSRVPAAGGKVLMPKTQMGDRTNGFIAQFIDSEGNRVGLHSTN